MDKEQKAMWDRLSTPYTSNSQAKYTIDSHGTKLYIDTYGNGLEVNEYNLSTPYDVATASYVATVTVGM